MELWDLPQFSSWGVEEPAMETEEAQGGRKNTRMLQCSENQKLKVFQEGKK